MCDRNINLRVLKMEYDIPSDLYTKRVYYDDKTHNILKKIPIIYNIPKKRAIPDIVMEKSNPISPQFLMEQLLSDIYRFSNRRTSDSDRCTFTSLQEFADFGKIVKSDLIPLNEADLGAMIVQLKKRTHQYGTLLMKRLYQRDALKRRRAKLSDCITEILRKIDKNGDTDMKFSVSPKGGANGWAEWLKAMKLVARLPTGIPPEFRKKLWLTLAEQHLKVKGVDWSKAEKNCFSEWTNPDDTELGVQIVKDLHRTGCSLFCGTEGRENQAVLKRVLLAYARWNKAVGYCQGFNMLAALILEVMDRSESDSLKVMIYLIEAVLPEGYFANNLRGLSVDMAVFRDLLKLRLPRLSAHLEKLQKGAAEGSCYEPPLTNVFTMQWFLTLFCNCLPRSTVLRVWDLVFLEGDEILLTTALAIWDTLQDRILVVESADEFYSVMGELARQTLEAPPATSEALLTRAAQLGPVPELPKLRDKHRYNITPWAHTVQSAAKKGLRLFYSEDETDSSDEGDKLAITTAYGLQSSGRGRGALVAAGVFGHPDREKLALDISALKQQYARLRERQRQAHIILAAACARQPSVGVNTGTGPLSVNHLLLGKSAIVSSRGRRLGPPQGAIPPSRSTKSKNTSKTMPIIQNKMDTLDWKDENHKKSLIRRDSIKWKDIKQSTTQNDDAEEDQCEEGKSIPESEVNEILQTSMRTRRKSESSSYSECSESSTSTSLCDEPNRLSDFDSEPASFSENYMSNMDEYKDDFHNLSENVNSDLKSPIDKLENEDVERNNSEFGNYVQEFADLLDKTKSIENTSMEDLSVIPADAENNTSMDIDHFSHIDTENTQVNFENIQNIDVESLSIGDASDMINIETNYTEDQKSADLIQNTDNLSVENKSEHSFDEFVDSNKGEPLRNYLDEFRKADNATKREKLWEHRENFDTGIGDTKNEIQTLKMDPTYEEPKKNVESELDLISQDNKNVVQQNDSNIDDMKPFVYHDYHSNSCERSISSSISSISPVLRCLAGFSDDPPSYMCYKSPARVESESGIELGGDEKPIVLKIDKYFEHSPEFFGARKSGTYVSSDEEEESVQSKIVKTPSLDSTETPETSISKEKKIWSNPYATDIESFEKIIQHEIDEVKELQENESLEVRKSSLSPLPIKSIIGELSSNIPEKYYIHPSTSYTPKEMSPKSVYNIDNLESIRKVEFAKSPIDRNDDTTRVNILEKTKSEELPMDQKRTFSILDEEIEAIKSQSGRRNSERALRIIQENSKILHRILINQVNKSNIRDSLQEEPFDPSNDPANQQEKNKKILRLFEYRTHKTLPSPRSSSLDESLQRKNKQFSLFPENMEYETGTTKIKETTPDAVDSKLPKILDTPIKTPPSPISFVPKSNVSHDFNHENNVKTAKNISSPITPIVVKEENKTDIFGWENKGFSANQQIESYYNSDYVPSKPFNDDDLSSYIEKNEELYKYSSKLKTQSNENIYDSTISNIIEPVKLSADNLELSESIQLSTPDNDKNSTLTAVSDAVVEISDCSKREFTESWKIENNNSLSESYNVSSPYKFTFRSTENSGYIDGVFKSRAKLIDSPISRVSDVYSKVTESSPLENLKTDVFKYETSQSSDLCFVSSSMSFSFDPSVDDQPSSKPPTFNSSDTLCQLTSLDQVSTPISPKTLNYPTSKDSAGFSQKELSLELDKFRLNSEDSCAQISLTDHTLSSIKSPSSPTQSNDKSHSMKSPDKNFNPFPVKTSYRQPKELGFRLGLYKDPLKSPSK